MVDNGNGNNAEKVEAKKKEDAEKVEAEKKGGQYVLLEALAGFGEIGDVVKISSKNVKRLGKAIKKASPEDVKKFKKSKIDQEEKED